MRTDDTIVVPAREQIADGKITEFTHQRNQSNYCLGTVAAPEGLARAYPLNAVMVHMLQIEVLGDNLLKI